MYGARPLARVIQTEVRDPLTDEILFGRLEHGGTVTIEHRRRTSSSSPTQPKTRGAPGRAMSDKEHEIPVKVVDRRWWAPGRDERRDARRRVRQADLRRGARTAGRREGQAARRNPSRSIARRRASSRSRGCGCAARSRRTSSAAAARSSPICSRSSTTWIARSSRRAARRRSSKRCSRAWRMVRRQFLSKLEGLGVRRIEADGRRFDPAMHEAISTVPAATRPSRTARVVGVVRHGYRSATTCCGRRQWRWRRADKIARV